MSKLPTLKPPLIHSQQKQLPTVTKKDRSDERSGGSSDVSYDTSSPPAIPSSAAPAKPSHVKTSVSITNATYANTMGTNTQSISRPVSQPQLVPGSSPSLFSVIKSSSSSNVPLQRPKSAITPPVHKQQKIPVTALLPPTGLSNNRRIGMSNNQSNTLTRNYIRSPPTVCHSAPTPTAALDDELLNQLLQDDLIHRLKQLESRNRKLTFDNGSLMKDLNHTLSQLQSLKHENFQLSSDNNELKELCYYLDDERTKATGLARDWQSFGTHMSRVMRQQVATYAAKLSQLEKKQFELIRKNFELKQLCLLLDNAMMSQDPHGQQSETSNNLNPAETTGSSGSVTSNGSLALETPTSSALDSDQHPTSSQAINGNIPRGQDYRLLKIPPQIVEYTRSLEIKVQQLEWEKKQLLMQFVSSPDVHSVDSTPVIQKTSSNNSSTTFADVHHPHPSYNSYQQNVQHRPGRNVISPPAVLTDTSAYRRSQQQEAQSTTLNIQQERQTTNHPVTHSKSSSSIPTFGSSLGWGRKGSAPATSTHIKQSESSHLKKLFSSLPSSIAGFTQRKVTL